jgi:hypothetical protein
LGLLIALTPASLVAAAVPSSAAAYDTRCYAYGYTPHPGAGGPYVYYGYGFANCGGDSVNLRGRLQQLGLDGVWHGATPWSYYHSGYAPSARDFARSVSCLYTSRTRYFRTQVQIGWEVIPYTDPYVGNHTSYSYQGYASITCL